MRLVSSSEKLKASLASIFDRSKRSMICVNSSSKSLAARKSLSVDSNLADAFLDSSGSVAQLVRAERS